MTASLYVFADWGAIWPRLVGFGAIAVIIGVVVGAIKFNPARRLRSILDEELSADDAKHEPLVGIAFHTCYGVLHFSVHNTHSLRLSAPAAERLLRRLHKFNCMWGWLTPGGPLVPFVSRSEYRAQLRSIEEQLQFGDFTYPT